jgi:hypothetical protein
MIPNVLATVVAFAAVALAIVVPGALLVRLLGLGRSPIERFGLAVVLGRVLLGLVGLLLSSFGAMGLAPWLAAAALAALAAYGGCLLGAFDVALIPGRRISAVE